MPGPVLPDLAHFANVAPGPRDPGDPGGVATEEDVLGDVASDVADLLESLGLEIAGVVGSPTRPVVDLDPGPGAGGEAEFLSRGAGSRTPGNTPGCALPSQRRTSSASTARS